MKRIFLFLTIFMITFCAEAQNVIHVATNGVPNGLGTEISPVDLYSTMRGSTSNVSVVAGDIIAIHEGTYNVNALVWLSGSSGNPITIRPWEDDVVVIDTNVGDDLQYWPGGNLVRMGFDITGSNLVFQDLFFTNSDTRQRYSYSEIYGEWDDVAWGGGMQIQGDNVDVINCYFYDILGGAIGSYRDGGTFYGNIMWYNGFDAPDRGHGHGMYLQNEDPNNPKIVENNIILKGMMYGVKAYGTASSLNGIQMRHNTSFNAAQLSVPGPSKDTGVNLFIGGRGVPAENCYMDNNTTYKSEIDHTMRGPNIRLGWITNSNSVWCRDNYVVGGNRVITSEGNNFLEVTGNTFVVRDKSYESAQNDRDYIISIKGNFDDPPVVGVGLDNTTFDNNSYFVGNNPNPLQVSYLDVAGVDGWISINTWQNTVEQDQGSTFTSGLPSTNFTKVEPNQYKPYRAHVTIYNWELLDFVDIDPSSFLNMGDSYYVYDTENMFGGAVATGTWNGGNIPIPMDLTEIAQPIYNENPQVQYHTEMEFGSYMVQDRPFNHPNAEVLPPVSDGPWFVSPTGSAAGNGSAGNPWDFQTALNNPLLETGDIIYITAGVYTDNVNIDVSGNGNNPITITPFSTSPLMSGGINVSGNYVVVEGLVFQNSMQVTGDANVFEGCTFNAGLQSNAATRLLINQCTFNGTNDILRLSFPNNDRRGDQYNINNNIYNISGQALFNDMNWSFYRMSYDRFDRNSQFNYTP